jgi:hypothetical protein
MTSPAVLYFSRLSQEKMFEHKLCVSIFASVLPEPFYFLRSSGGDIIEMYIGLNVKYLLFSSSLIKLEFFQHT